MDLKGLTEKEAGSRLENFGLNEIEITRPGAIKRIIKRAAAPVTLLLFAAAALSYALGKIFDFYFILVLAGLNVFVSFWHEKKADDALKKLQEQSRVSARVLRDGAWRSLDAKLLVPGDIVKLEVGNVIPADIAILQENNFTVNESALTGESIPAEKGVGETCYSGAFVSTGYATASVEKTGESTYFAKTLLAAAHAKKRSLLEKDIISITKLLSLLSAAAIIVLSFTLILEKKPLIDLLTLNLSLIIAGIPISLPTVMTMIISVGIMRLAKVGVVVRKIASLENLSNVDLLLTDKTGTLTKNEVGISRIIPAEGFTEDEVVRFASIGTSEEEGPVKKALLDRCRAKGIALPAYKIKKFFPHDSERKRSTSYAIVAGAPRLISLGAPQIIKTLIGFGAAEKKKFEESIREYAGGGYRVIALALGDGEKEKGMRLAGVMLFSDVLREDAKETISFMREHGIETKIVSGDNHAITTRIARELGLRGEIWDKEKMVGADIKNLPERVFREIAAFAEVLPVDKYNIVERAKKGNVVAATGDGANDIPPVEAADVGVAVKNAVDALKSAADINILREGISYIETAVIEARKIFYRLYSYGIYRISESFRVIFNILVIGVFYKDFPLLPIQLIILALLNDIPIISLAFNRVRMPKNPPKIESKKRTVLGATFGAVGTINSLIFFFLFKNAFGLSWETMQTMFFLKLSVSGHMLIYVAHTKERWYKFLPSKQVIAATTATQFFATVLAAAGIFMSKIDFRLILIVWLWAIIWMQVTEGAKIVEEKLSRGA